jgi:hypothetical protein
MSSQGAGNNGGQAAGRQFVSFTRPAAQRIAKVVRTVEAGDRGQPGLRFDHPMPGGVQKVFRVCTFTGSWDIGEAKTVTYKYQTSTPNTAMATNLFFPVTGTASADFAIAREGTAWFLIDVPFYTATGVFVKSTASSISATSTAALSFVTDINITASLNTTNCTISVGKTLTTATAVFITGTATSSYIASSRTVTFVLLEKP